MSVPSSLKRFLKILIPAQILNRYSATRTTKLDKELAGGTLQETFSKIYSNGLWGASAEAGFYSGTGSHDETIVGPYVEAVRAFIGTLPERPSAVDLGCGDFNVGRQILDVFGSYTACDVVPDLIADNQRRYADLDVHFRVVDIASDPLPSGDVVLVRQVLQHLSNADITAALAKIGAYEYAIITEHVPAVQPFTPNIDKLSGAGTRLGFQSGIVLTEPPFSLEPLSQQILCEVPESTGLIRTIAYKFR